ncbi:MAG: polyphosphate polymerase domain-containing protein [Planctomycetota bacterium]
MTATATPLHFSRFEFKYVMPQALRREVEAELGHFVHLDAFVQDQPDQQYFVRSLYFDDPVYSCFRAKVDGQHTRSKFRIRTYTDAAVTSVPWFLEIKGRFNNLVFKHRVPLAPLADPTLAGERLARAVLAAAPPGRVREQFEFQLFRRQLRPIVRVDYRRRPYISRFDPDFRVTFDSELRAAADDAMVPARGPAARALLPGYTVMEVKFRHHVPAWFHRVLQAYDLRRVSISKVCTGVQALGLQSDPN